MVRTIIVVACVVVAAFVAWNIWVTPKVLSQKEETISISPIFMKLANSAQLEDLLKGNGPVTIFWPQDKAFLSIDVEALQKPENVKQLQNLLLNHVVKGEITTKDIKSEMKVLSLAGNELTIKNSDGKITINDSKVVKPDIQFNIFGHANGTIQVIDKVIK